jgi:hypothetical protein
MKRYQQQIDRLNTIREGVKALKQLSEEGSATRADKQNELDTAKQQKDHAQQLRDQAKSTDQSHHITHHITHHTSHITSHHISSHHTAHQVCEQFVCVLLVSVMGVDVQR